ncbi:DUF2061 domain-containing protein [Futiania mangrovi]|uniref:DUF2061 domain-containing protein n=1 Tax=Futiania mangrovi TaxID=2959716 RepID=A0A9J6PE47_9PROT|nr:DUF2061 domain-containing protein [Futiania mangrovii]MCP1336678.1 DUF2061 domain-containing protein [Futiania mangrovii]
MRIAKTATYGTMHLAVAVTVAYAVSGSWAVALGIGLLEPAVQTVAYMLHERFWDRRSRVRGVPNPPVDACHGHDPRGIFAA